MDWLALLAGLLAVANGIVAYSLEGKFADFGRRIFQKFDEKIKPLDYRNDPYFDRDFARGKQTGSLKSAAA